MTPNAHPLIMKAQYIKDLSFENPKPLEAFSQNLDVQPSIAVNIGAHAENLDPTHFEVTLEVRAEAKRDDNVLFIAELTYAALVEVKNAKDTDVGPIVMIDVPHLIFPYARNIISDATRDGGFPPLLLAPVDFTAIYQEQKAKQAAAQSSQ